MADLIKEAPVWGVNELGEIVVEAGSGSNNVIGVVSSLQAPTNTVTNKPVFKLPSQNEYDVVVFGATPGGIMAAIAASLEGSSVAIYESSDKLGGVATGGLQWWDINRDWASAMIVGLGNKFLRELADEYGITWQSFYGVNPNAEPKIVLKKFGQWIARYKIPVFYNNDLVSVTKIDTRITSALFTSAGAVKAKAFIDSSYTGDMLAAAGCSFSIGRESNATYGETLNGITVPVSLSQFVNAVDPYVIPGQPSSGLLYGVNPKVIGPAGSADPTVMAFNYRLLLTRTAGKVAIPEPDKYDASQYEVMGRHAVANGSGWTVADDIILMYGLRGTDKWDANHRGAFSLDYIDPVCTEYVTATPKRRKEIEYIIRQYILGLFKFLKTDPRIPVAVRNDVALLGFAPDEFQKTGGFSPDLYVREGRRLVGDFVMKESDVTSLNSFTDGIAFSYYSLDSHVCQRVVVGGLVKNEGTVAGSPAAGNRFPYRILLPKAAECTNLLVTFGTSVSHVVFRTIRMEPIHMGLGHAAGVAAAMCAQTGLNVQALGSAPYMAQIQAKQDRFGVAGAHAVLSVDATTYTQGSVTSVLPANWTSVAYNAASDADYVGCGYAISTTNTAAKKFSPNIRETGSFKVFVRWPEKNVSVGGVQRSTITPTTVSHASGTVTVVVDQNLAITPTLGDSGDWCYIGTYVFRKGTPSADFVTVTTDGVGGSTIVAAVKWLAV